MTMVVNSVPVTATGTFTLSTFTGSHFLSGWYFTETGGTDTITVTVRADTAAGNIIEKLTIPTGTSVGEDYGDHPVSVQGAVYVSVTGAGVCQGAIRGR